MWYYEDVGILDRIFRGRITALQNRFNPLYNLRFYYPDNKELNELLCPGAAPSEKIRIRAPIFSEKTLFRNAERVARARISGLARRFDCDIVVLENERINGADPLNPDFEEEEKPRIYSVVACFYGSADYLNRHLASSRQRLIQRKI